VRYRKIQISSEASSAPINGHEPFSLARPALYEQQYGFRIGVEEAIRQLGRRLAPLMAKGRSMQAETKCRSLNVLTGADDQD
jgi:hypothetical protein